MRMDVVMDATLGCGRPHEKRPQLEFLEILLPHRTARAVKGGEAEAPDVSAPSLEGPGITWTQWSRPAPLAGLDALLSAGVRVLPPVRRRRARAVSTRGASVCLYVAGHFREGW